jgi:hypothetical protein
MLLNYGSSLQVAVHYMRSNHLQSISKQVLEPNDLFLRKKLCAIYATKIILTSYDPVDRESGIQLRAKADTIFRAEFTTTLRPNLLLHVYWGLSGQGMNLTTYPYLLLKSWISHSASYCGA